MDDVTSSVLLLMFLPHPPTFPPLATCYHRTRHPHPMHPRAPHRPLGGGNVVFRGSNLDRAVSEERHPTPADGCSGIPLVIRCPPPPLRFRRAAQYPACAMGTTMMDVRRVEMTVVLVVVVIIILRRVIIPTPPLPMIIIVPPPTPPAKNRGRSSRGVGRRQRKMLGALTSLFIALPRYTTVDNNDLRI